MHARVQHFIDKLTSDGNNTFEHGSSDQHFKEAPSNGTYQALLMKKKDSHDLHSVAHQNRATIANPWASFVLMISHGLI